MKSRAPHSLFPGSLLLVGFATVLAASCGQDHDGPAQLGAVAEAVTGSCTADLFGFPCDPDGPMAATECQGICWIGTNGGPTCLPVATVGLASSDLNGRVCGNADASDCTRSCENGVCSTKNADVGSSCRPAGLGNSCSGNCTVVGVALVCQPAPIPCVGYGVNQCTFTACDFGNNVSGCDTSYNLRSGTVCDDGDACTLNDRCNAVGVCVPGTTSPGCIDGGGAGGTSGTGGTSGSGGTAGTGATSGTGGVGGTAGTSGAGGTAGTSGTGGTAGTSGTGGTAGTSGAGGTAGTSGTAGTGGTAATGGASGAGGASGSGAVGGAAGSGGASGAAGGDGGPGLDGGDASAGAAGNAGVAGGGGDGARAGTTSGDGGGMGGTEGGTGGGAATGGNSATGGSGATSAQGGSAGGGASPSDAGPDATTPRYAVFGGACGCTVPGTGSGTGGWLVLALLLALRRRPRRAHALAAAAGLLASSGVVHAAGFAVDRYPAPVSPADLMWLERARLTGGPGFARLTLGYSDDPVVLVDRNKAGNEIRIVDSQVAAYLSGGLIFDERVQAAVLVPLYFQAADSRTVGGSAVDPSGAAFGDPGLDVRYALLRKSSASEMALAATLRLPLGKQDALAGDGGAVFWPRVLLGARISETGSWIGASAGARLRPTNTFGDIEAGTEATFTAGALLALTRGFGVTAEAGTSSGFSNLFSEQLTPVEVTAGPRWSIGSLVAAAGLGAGLTRGYGAPDVRIQGTVGLLPPGREPMVRQPAAPADRDGDGIFDDHDGCADEPEDKDGFEDADGCPDPDNDNDGVLDPEDQCPGDPEDRDGYRDDDGCPEMDNDGDGILDAADKCPTEPEDVDGWKDDDGCPEADNDGDGIPDARDECPNEPETMNGKDDEDGCPDLVRVEKGRLRTLEPIYFEYNRAIIQARSEPLLVEMAQVLKSRADLGKLSIEGHTDTRGADAYNLDLSRRRAESVMKFLVDAGVASDRLSARGFGETKPVADNGTDAGRAANRRVEFVFIGAPSDPGAAAPP